MGAKEGARFGRVTAAARLLWAMLRDAAYAWSEDRAVRKGAAIAYYTAFSLAPLLIIAINVASIVFGQSAASGEVHAQMRALLGPQGASTVQAMIASAGRPGSGLWPVAVGIVTIVIGATSALVELKDGLDEIWNVPASSSWSVGRHFAEFVRTRLLAIGMVLALALLLLVSLVMSAVLTVLSRAWSEGDAATALLQLGDWAVSFLLVTALFAMMYKLLPSVGIDWRDALVGAAGTAVLFEIGKYLIGIYLRHSAVTSMYGAAGSLLIVLIWTYYSAQIVLYGAEITKIYARRFGSHRASGGAKAGMPLPRSGDDASERI